MRYKKIILLTIVLMSFVHCASQNKKSPDFVAMDHCKSLSKEEVPACWEAYLVQKAKTDPDIMERCHASLSLAEFYSGYMRRTEAKQIYETLLRQPPSAECNKWATIGYKGFSDLGPGKAPPQFKAITSDGSNFDTSRIRDKAVILFFWTSWCGACEQDYTDMKYLQSNFGHKVKIIGISGDLDKRLYESAIKTNEFTWPNIFDGNDFEGPISKLYSIHQYPTIVLVNSQGRIVGDRYRFERLRQIIRDMK